MSQETLITKITQPWWSKHVVVSMTASLAMVRTCCISYKTGQLDKVKLFAD